MFSDRLRWLGPLALLLCHTPIAVASPISYVFTGTLSQPYDGSSTFSGAISYDTDPSSYRDVQSQPGWSHYAGTTADPAHPVCSLTITLGDSPFSPGPAVNEDLTITHDQYGDLFLMTVQFQVTGRPNLLAQFGLRNDNRIQQAPLNSLAPPSSLSLADFNLGGDLTIFGTGTDGRAIHVEGKVNWLGPPGTAPPPVPEPATLLVFAVVAVESMRRCRARHRPSGSR